MMKRLCPECGVVSEWEEITRPEEYKVREETIIINTSFLSCSECHAEYQDLKSEVDPYNLAYEEYRRRRGMVHPSQIVDFRKKYGLTQKELSKLLGLGDITLSRYENGSLQDNAHDQLLRFILDPVNLLRIVKQKQDLLSEKKREKILNQLKSDISRSYILEELLNSSTSSIYSGNRVFDLEKMTNVIKFFTFQNPVYKSKLFKLLFYADFKTYKEVEVSLTGLQYAHLPYGPVPEKYEFLLATVLEINPAITIDVQYAGDFSGEVILSSEPYDRSFFTEHERNIMTDIHNYFHSFTAKKIEDFSHEEIGYKETQQSKLISYEYAKDLII